ncbi:MAG: prepilin-type N-terminal cleavage/methylation domain-containing protein [Deltaproteobacteria bacterium]
MMPLNLRKENRGFTLIELLVAMGLGLVVLGAVLKVFVSQNRTNVAQQEVAYAQQNVRAAMDLMAREIRNAGYDPEDNNFEAIKTATSGSIRILSNLSGDDEAGDPNDPNEDVTYTVNGSNQLTRSGNRMVDFVNNLQFGYVLKDGTVLDPPGAALTAEQRADVRTVIIRLGVRTENPDRDTGDFRVRNLMSRVRIRNMGFQDIET